MLASSLVSSSSPLSPLQSDLQTNVYPSWQHSFSQQCHTGRISLDVNVLCFQSTVLLLSRSCWIDLTIIGLR
jgi:hypothetical protein